MTYSVETDGNNAFTYGRLVAQANGKTYEVIGKEKKRCMEVVDERDFDGNGTTDALVRTSSTCGGNCCPEQYLFVSALGGGRFVVSDEFADSWDEPTVERWKGRWSVVVVSQDPMKRVTRRFVLENGHAVKVQESAAKTLKALVELRSEMFKAESEDEEHAIHFDLDGDGKKDVITGRLWLRWHSILWSVQFADGKSFQSSLGCGRIGVLASKTNGVHDLVCDQDSILTWNGREYKE